MTNHNEGTTPNIPTENPFYPESERIVPDEALPPTDLAKFLESFSDSTFYRRTSYRGYILIYQPLIGDCHIFDVQGELIDATGMGTTGAHLMINEWVDEAR